MNERSGASQVERARLRLDHIVERDHQRGTGAVGPLEGPVERGSRQPLSRAIGCSIPCQRERAWLSGQGVLMPSAAGPSFVKRISPELHVVALADELRDYPAFAWCDMTVLPVADCNQATRACRANQLDVGIDLKPGCGRPPAHRGGGSRSTSRVRDSMMSSPPRGAVPVSLASVLSGTAVALQTAAVL